MTFLEPDSSSGRPMQAGASRPASRSPEPLEADYLFLRPTAAGSHALVCFLGALLAFGIAVVGGIVAFTSHVSPISLQAMTTLPILLGLGALSGAWAFAGAPSQVSVGSQGMTVVERKGKQTYSWGQIGYASIKAPSLGQGRQLVICDARGKAIVKLGEAFSEFDLLTELVQRHIAAKKDDTAEQIRRRKAKRSALFLTIFCPCFLALAAGNIWIAYDKQRANHLLAEAAVPGKATILERRIAPNGVTCRLEYRVDTPEGRSGTHNAEVTRPYWESLESATTVPVVYVPEEPSISRLVTGEVIENDMSDRPVVMYVLSTFIGLIALVAGAVAMLQWWGWDLDFDSKTHRLSIRRFGTGR